MEKKTFSLDQLKLGDKIAVHVNLDSDGGYSLGAGVRGDDKHLHKLTFTGIAYDKMLQCHTDDMRPIGLLFIDDVYEIYPQEGLEIFKRVYLNKALEIGNWAMKEYITQFHMVPFEKGTKIAPTHDYHVKNKNANIRSSHQTIANGDLEFFTLNTNSITVYSPSLNKTANLALDAFTVKKQ